jgi:hypothetical protein
LSLFQRYKYGVIHGDDRVVGTTVRTKQKDGAERRGLGVGLCHVSKRGKTFGPESSRGDEAIWSSNCNCCVRVSGVAHIQNWLCWILLGFWFLIEL